MEYLLKTRGFLGGMMEEKELHNLLSQQLRDEVISVGNKVMKVQGRILAKQKIMNTLFNKALIEVIPKYL